MGADTLLLCGRPSRVHTEVWEAVCRRGSQRRRGRGGRVTGARSASRRELWGLRRGTRGTGVDRGDREGQAPQADGDRDIRRKVIPPEPGYTSLSRCFSELTDNYEPKRPDKYHRRETKIRIIICTDTNDSAFKKQTFTFGGKCL